MQVALSALWLPILLSGVGVFVASSIVWMAIQYHDADWKKLPDEEAARSALRNATPGEYSIPHAASNKARQDEAWQAKWKEGPAAMITVVPHGSFAMGKQLASWFAYTIIVSVFIAYVAAVTLPAGTPYLKVFQVVGTVAALAYAGNAAAGSIWFGHTWSRTIKDIIDGVAYGLVTAGVFGWLWP